MMFVLQGVKIFLTLFSDPISAGNKARKSWPLSTTLTAGNKDSPSHLVFTQPCFCGKNNNHDFIYNNTDIW